VLAFGSRWGRNAADIHGNLPALEAVIGDLSKQGADEIWCGGDIGWGGPWASECIQIVREAGWTTVRGNTDVWITGDPQTVDDEGDRELLRATAQAHAITPEDARWLMNLPIGHTGPGSMLLVHGTPDSPFEAPLPDAPVRDFRPYESKAAIVFYGHVHLAFTRRLQDGTLVCNSGSVGLPADAPSASYLIVDQRGSDYSLVHRRVGFDRSKVTDAARASGNPFSERFLQLLGEP
jgi:predicted phosphodiesterase